MKELIKQIIPPKTRECREGFSNKMLIDQLSEDDRYNIKKELIALLIASEDTDLLVVETLVYLRCQEALRYFHLMLSKNPSPITFFGLALAIYQLSNDDNVINIMENKMLGLTEQYQIVTGLNYLAQIRDSRVVQILNRYANSDSTIVAGVAKSHLVNRT
jgi:hypothetical protein